MPETLSLHDAHWRVVVSPAHGGSLQLCEFDGRPVLMPTAPAARNGAALPSCCYFPLIPFSNRIENGEFQFAGAKIRVPANLADTPHAIHGHGWQAAWQAQSATPTQCSLAYRHEAGADWPWRYEGTQSFAIVDDALRITLAIRNLCDSAMPCGLGFHPFFPAGNGARLQLHARRIWNGSARDFPRQPVAVPRHLCFDAGAPLAERLGTDHCYDGWQRQALVTYGDRDHDIVVRGSEATDFLVVYIPEGADYFCLEPVTHAVNAMNLRDPAAAGLWALEPAECREIAMTIAVRRSTWAR